MSTLGKNIKRLRREKGISQDKLSKLADISLNTVVKIELDQSPNPTLETIQKLAKAFGVSLDDLIKSDNIKSRLK
ncbi:MAG: helix-turn-helix transcriptional regulator [Patescibacteria group bacterium]